MFGSQYCYLQECVVCVYQEQVDELEERLDQLHADFSQQSMAAMELKDKIHDLEQEVSKQTELANQGQAKEDTVKESVSKLNALRAQLAALEIKKSGTGDSVEECQQELNKKRGAVSATPTPSDAASQESKKKGR